MDDSVKDLELKRQIKTLEFDRNRLINELSNNRTTTREQSTLINNQISNISKEINELMKEKEKNTLTTKNIINILQKYFDVLDKNKKMIITVKPNFTTNLFIIYYLSKEDDYLGRYILYVSKKEVNTLTIFDKTTWDDNDEGEEFFDRDTFRRNNYNFSHSAQFKFYRKSLNDVQIHSICILNGNNKKLVFDIKKVASKIQNVYRKNVIKRKKAADVIATKYLEYSYKPGGPGYNRAMNRYYSFGKPVSKRISKKQLDADIRYLSR